MTERSASGDVRKAVEVRVGGRRFRVLSSASPEEVRRLAGLVEARIEAIAPGRGADPEALILAAMSLAHDLQEAELAVRQGRMRATAVVARALSRVDSALADVDAGRRGQGPDILGGAPDSGD